MTSIIHFNNAGAAIMADPAREAMQEFQVLEHRLGGYEAAELQGQTLTAFKSVAARLIGAKAINIAEMPGASAAWQRPFAAITFKSGDRIITHELEYGANYLSILIAAKRYGVIIDICRSSEQGVIDLDHLKSLITPQTRLISVTHMSAHSGVVQPVVDIGALARAHNILYFLDSSQAIGQIPIDVGDVSCDVMTATGRKFLRGPRGTGFLYASEEFCQTYPPYIAELQSAYINQNGMAEFYQGAQRYENWEANISARIGLTKAMEYTLSKDIDIIANKIANLTDFAADLIAKKTRFTCFPKSYQPKPHQLKLRRQSGILALDLDVPAKFAQNYLRENKVNVSIISPSAAPLSLGDKQDLSAIRISLHDYNTQDEIRRCVDLLSNMPVH